MDFTEYNNAISNIRALFENNFDYESVLAQRDNLCSMFGTMYPEDTREHWKELVDYTYEYYQKYRESDDGWQDQISGKMRNKFKVPTDPNSCWQIYYSNIHFSNKERIQLECKSILNQLSDETKPDDPVKGLVVGNIQSGKTLNMGGVISMAMDYKWNLIIVLSGTIESLRKQTERRLKKNLRSTTDVRSLQFRDIKWLEIGANSDYSETIKYDIDNRVYITVCLKQAVDLMKLIRHINKNQSVKSKMRVLVIDDEADQASVNTSALEEDAPIDARNTINRRLIQLINGYDHNGIQAAPYKAMNYVAYTATPYANLLSENELEGNTDGEDEAMLYSNLYPKDFIRLLRPAKEYFGPTQIFGYPPQDLEGLNIINTDEDTHARIKHMVDSESTELPEGLKDAIAWFICCVPIKRRWVKEQPISMLINPDMQTDIHSKLASSIEEYLRENKEEILSRCHRVYDVQKGKLSSTEFVRRMGCVDNNGVAKNEDGSLINPYCSDPSEINDYPRFDEIVDDIKKLISIDPEPYTIDGDNRVVYHDGIHICIDNSKSNDMPRLIYPDKYDLEEREEPYPDPAPAIIVIGGNTLSRGLTIEGLVSTYFSRKMTQADVSMQMCRWFGYRQGYELLPRIWMSPAIRRKFLKSIDIDESLRRFMHDNYYRYTPLEMVARIKSYPGLRATSKQKSRGAIASEFDYSGYTRPTSKFYTSPGILDSNMALTRKLLDGRRYSECAFMKGDRKSLWTYAANSEVVEYLREFQSPDMDPDFEGEIKIDLEGIEKKLAELNSPEWVIVVNNPNGARRSWITLDGKDVGVAGRSKTGESDDGCIEIASRLINARDQYADCDPTDFKNPYKEQPLCNYAFEYFDNHSYDVYAIREGCGRLDYPVLMIYGISGSELDGKYGLGLDKDVIGLCIQMPGAKHSLGAATLYQLKPNEGGTAENEM